MSKITICTAIKPASIILFAVAYSFSIFLSLKYNLAIFNTIPMSCFIFIIIINNLIILANKQYMQHECSGLTF